MKVLFSLVLVLTLSSSCGMLESGSSENLPQENISKVEPVAKNREALENIVAYYNPKDQSLLVIKPESFLAGIEDGSYKSFRWDGVSETAEVKVGKWDDKLGRFRVTGTVRARVKKGSGESLIEEIPIEGARTPLEGVKKVVVNEPPYPCYNRGKISERHIRWWIDPTQRPLVPMPPGTKSVQLKWRVYYIADPDGDEKLEEWHEKVARTYIYKSADCKGRASKGPKHLGRDVVDLGPWPPN